MNEQRVQVLVRELLKEIGEDPDREGLRDTPARVAKSYAHLTSGYRMDPATVINDATFAEEHNNMVIVRNIEIYSLCEHHMLPFFGRCHIGYIPRERIFGISKLARLADLFSLRLQIQERLTDQIARIIDENIKPHGVGVVIEAQHLCMMMRGVEKQSSVLTTSSMLGTFRSSHATRSEFLSLVAKRCHG
jgi:GTP cyclohydrolase IA